MIPANKIDCKHCPRVWAQMSFGSMTCTTIFAQRLTSRISLPEHRCVHFHEVRRHCKMEILCSPRNPRAHRRSGYLRRWCVGATNVTLGSCPVKADRRNLKPPTDTNSSVHALSAALYLSAFRNQSGFVKRTCCVRGKVDRHSVGVDSDGRWCNDAHLGRVSLPTPFESARRK